MRTKRALLLSALTAAAILAATTAFTRKSSAVSQEVKQWQVKVSSDLMDQIETAKASLAMKSGETAGAEPWGEMVDVIVQTSDGVRKEHKDAVRRLGGKVKRVAGVINGFSARVPVSAIEELGNRDDLAFISPDRPIQLMGHLETTTGAAQIRSLVSGTTLNGNGVGIAILDSGIDSTHHSITYNGVTRISVQVAASGFRDADDYSGHGSHVATVAAGTNHIGPNLYTGIAPGAKILDVKILDREGRGYTSDIIAGVNWCVSYRTAYNIKVINLSLGAPAIDSYKNDPLCKAVRTATDAGIVVVVAAGNDGKDDSGKKLYGTIHSPGIEPAAITVGAANTFGTDVRSDDMVTTYSSRGPTRGSYKNGSGQRVYDNLLKPDLVAPGNKIISAQAYDADLTRYHPEMDANAYETNSYHYVMYMSGTSVSAPVVSGATALLLQANPSLTPNLVKAILMYTAQPLYGFNTFEQGAGLLNIDGALRIAKIVKNPVTNLSNGAAMLTASLPSQQSTIAGNTFQWGQGVITDYTFL